MVNAVRASPKKRKRRTLVVGDRDGWVCWLCHQAVQQGLASTDSMHASLDHVVPRWLGGSNDVSNLRISHHKCNHERDAEERRKHGLAN
jgi:5-methylcytosine-specific restriction endonuclease McrA